jgi:prepilin-type N-terminal cleavage/methylation domain-containing protein
MRRLVVLKQIQTEGGFNLLEVIIVTVIIGIVSAVSVPNLLGSQRDNEAKEAWTKIRGALVEAQTNANRMSTTCIIQFARNTTNNEYEINGSPSGCLLEPFRIDASVVTVSSTGGTIPNSPSTRDIAFDFDGSLDATNTTNTDLQTLWITRNDFSGNPISGQGRCIVLGNWLGMIRTGIDNGSGVCTNAENLKYDNS